jgi:hypothetical protein
VKIFNVHERVFKLPPERVGKAVDNLAGPANIFWPVHKWPPMVLNNGLNEGSRGGHWFIRYTVAEYVPGKRAVFQFDQAGAVANWDWGRHYFEVMPRREHVILRHIVEGECSFKDWLSWRFVIAPLHDALLEDGFDFTENNLTGTSKSTSWSPWVKYLRHKLARNALSSNAS